MRHRVVMTDNPHADYEEDLLYSIKQALVNAVEAVMQILFAKGPSLQRGAYGCIAWNAQLAHCVGHTFGESDRVALAKALESDLDETVAQLTKTVMYVTLPAGSHAVGTVSKFDDPQSRYVWFFSDGFDRFCNILHALACSGVESLLATTEIVDPERLTSRKTLDAMQLSLMRKLVTSMGGDVLGSVMATQMESLRSLKPTRHSVITPEEMIVLQSASDEHTRRLVRESTATLSVLQFMEMHLSASGLRDACKIDSILPEESTSTYDLLEASARFVRLALPSDALWREQLLLEAVSGDERSWVVRGACSNEAEALTGWFASRGQRPASVAYWRLLGWRLADDEAMRLCNNILARLETNRANHANPGQSTEIMNRLIDMCLFCPTRFSMLMLVSFEKTSLLEQAIVRWVEWSKKGLKHSSESTTSTQATQATQATNPLLCFTRRLGGTVSFAYTTSFASAGLDEATWEQIHAYEDSVRFPATHAHVSDQADSEPVEDDMDLVGRVYQELQRAFTRQTALLMQSPECQWMLMTNGLSSYDRHEAEYVQICLRASIATQSLQLLTPPFVEGLCPLYNSPPFVYLPCIQHKTMHNLRTKEPSASYAPEVFSTEFAITMASHSTSDAAVRLLHRVGQNVAHLIDQALALRITHSETGEAVSPLHSSRHAALIMIMPPLHKSAQPVLFARFLTSTTATSFPPPATSDVFSDVLDVHVEALERDTQDKQDKQDKRHKAPPALLTIERSLAVLTKDDEQRIIRDRMAGGSVLAAKFALHMQDAATTRHKALRAQAERMQAAKIALQMQRMRQTGSKTVEALASQYKVDPQHVERMLAEAHKVIRKQLDPAQLVDEKEEPSPSDPSDDAAVREASEAFDAAFDELAETGMFEREVLHKSMRELQEATPYALDDWDERMDFAKRMLKQRDQLQGTPYDACTQHVMDTVCAARDEWITRGTHTLQGNVDPECGLIPMLITWETRASDLDRLGGTEALKSLRDRERRHTQHLVKLTQASETKDQQQLVKDVLRAMTHVQETPGLISSLQL